MKGKMVLLLASLGFLLWLVVGFGFTQMANQPFFDWLMFNVPSSELGLGILTLIVFALAGVVTARNSLYGESRIEELRNSNDKLTSLLNSLPVGVYSATPSGVVLQCNRQFAKTLGYESPQELRNLNLNSVYANKSDRQTYLEKLKQGPLFAEFEIVRKDGSTVWVREYPRAAMNLDQSIEHVDGVCVETHGMDAIMRDLTEHKRLRSMKDNFIVSVTHELRTPLVSIKGYVDHILTKEPDTPSKIKQQLEVVKRNTDQLLELTNDLLNIQDMENGKTEVRLEKLNLKEILDQCIEEIRPLLRDKEQDVKLDAPEGPLMILGDRLRLSQIMTNLLSNANKFAPNGGHLSVRVEQDEASATVSVSDNGIGIGKEDLGRVFEPFAAIQKPAYFKGSGLGLSLAKKLIEAQGGRIWVTSQGRGQGATFVFSLPKPKEELVRIHG